MSDLSRFIKAQETDYERALSEIRSGHKRSHWIWYIDVMGYPDDLKLRSSMTLFHEVAPEIDVFQKVLDKFFEGKPDQKTIELL